MNKERILELLLNAYVKMVEMKACSPGERSHMLAHHTEFIKRQITLLLKEVKNANER